MRTVRARRYPVIAAAVLAAAVTGVLVAGAPAQVADPADLRVTKSDSDNTVVRGQNLDYTIVVQNLGPDPADNVVVTDTLPAGVDFRSVSTSPPAGNTCARQGRKVTCNLGTIANGASETITIRTRVTRRQGVLENQVEVESTTADPVAANNSDTERTTVTLPPSGPRCQGARATIVGTNGNNVINGTAGRDVISAFGGDDSVFAGGGRDLVCLGAGFDLGVGGPKADSVGGGLNADRIRGKGGADVLRGKRGPDRLRGGRGPDFLGGGRGFDFCRGGPGADILRSCNP